MAGNLESLADAQHGLDCLANNLHRASSILRAAAPYYPKRVKSHLLTQAAALAEAITNTKSIVVTPVTPLADEYASWKSSLIRVLPAAAREAQENLACGYDPHSIFLLSHPSGRRVVQATEALFARDGLLGTYDTDAVFTQYVDQLRAHYDSLAAVRSAQPPGFFQRMLAGGGSVW